MGSERVSRESEPRLSVDQIVDTLDRLVTAVIRGDEFQLHLERELIEDYESLLAEIVRLRTALREIAEWNEKLDDSYVWLCEFTAAALGEDE